MLWLYVLFLILSQYLYKELLMIMVKVCFSHCTKIDVTIKITKLPLVEYIKDHAYYALNTQDDDVDLQVDVELIEHTQQDHDTFITSYINLRDLYNYKLTL